jgi:hypothetical protein
MENFNLQSYWENRYKNGGNSGVGSSGQEAMMKASLINHWIQQYDIRTINEVGCGDANNLLLYNVRMSYTGFDISPEAIKICKEKTRKIRNSLMYEFTTNYNDQNFDAELCLCLDVWYHAVEDQDFETLCKNLFVDFKGKYIIIYSTDSNSQELIDGTHLAPHVRFREVLSEIQKYSEWEVLYWISGIEVKDKENKIMNVQFPSSKRFYLLSRKN